MLLRPFAIDEQMTPAEMRTAHEAGRSIAQISQEARTDPETVQRFIRAAGGTVEDPGIPLPEPAPLEEEPSAPKAGELCGPSLDGLDAESTAEEIRAVYEAGWSGNDISRQTGLHTNTVYRRIRKAGGTIRGRKEPEAPADLFTRAEHPAAAKQAKRVRTPGDIDLAELRRLHASGMSPEAIGRYYRCRKQTVTAAMHLAGLPVPGLKNDSPKQEGAPDPTARAQRPENGAAEQPSREAQRPEAPPAPAGTAMPSQPFGMTVPEHRHLQPRPCEHTAEADGRLSAVEAKLDRLLETTRAVQEAVRAEEKPAEQRRCEWWRRHIASGTEIPEGARLAGWDTVLVTGPADHRAALVFFAAHPQTEVVTLGWQEAHEHGFRAAEQDNGQSEPEEPGGFPVVVAAVKWQR
ncbi:hypothetical protein [Nocardiopsis composta]|uniref:hypothetical protein n=1 Tax=Nocardiopsis composta TaxID=157465 RepID=UPI0031DFD9DB